MKKRSLIYLATTLASVVSCSLAWNAIETSAIDTGLDADGYTGILESRIHKCSVPGPSQRRMYIYLPEGYYGSDERYPVLYLLHGARGNEMSWILKGNLLHNIDSLTTCRMMEKTIVVLPNVNQYNDDNDYGKGRLKGAVESLFESDGHVEDGFIHDVVRAVDTLYRTIPAKEARAIAGLSIGAMQAMHISANVPDMFDYIGMFSPMVHPAYSLPGSSDFYKRLRVKQKIQFLSPPSVYSIMIGRSDFYYPRMKAFVRYLARKHYPYEFIVTKGGHDWYNWEEYANMFMKELWKGNQYLHNN